MINKKKKKGWTKTINHVCTLKAIKQTLKHDFFSDQYWNREVKVSKAFLNIHHERIVQKLLHKQISC